jgi:preprotein translocase subunit SecG
MKVKSSGFKDGIEKFVIVLMILFINLSLLVPIWQSATNSQLQMKLAQSEEALRAKEEQKMTLNASIAAKMTPEYLIEQSQQQNIVFRQITDSSTGAVANVK